MRSSSRFVISALLVGVLASGLALPTLAREATPGQEPAPGDEPRVEVVATVQALFDAMAAKDRVALEGLLVPEGRVIAMRGDTVAGTPGSTSQAEFVDAVVTSEGELLERMWEPTVLVDGSIALLRAPYDFHRDGVFSHCGVDHFSLVRTEAGWRIAGITYTVQRRGCEVSPLGPPGG